MTLDINPVPYEANDLSSPYEIYNVYSFKEWKRSVWGSNYKKARLQRKKKKMRKNPMALNSKTLPSKKPRQEMYSSEKGSPPFEPLYSLILETGLLSCSHSLKIQNSWVKSGII